MKTIILAVLVLVALGLAATLGPGTGAPNAYAGTADKNAARHPNFLRANQPAAAGETLMDKVCRKIIKGQD
jgi:hypothetical protein